MKKLIILLIVLSMLVFSFNILVFAESNGDIFGSLISYSAQELGGMGGFFSSFQGPGLAEVILSALHGN